ncbi:hypothetical protein KAX02_08125 [candidate division WOR-3 bacterium]|nr:hypothetical protein [candidate division WOR-3 bacterium]
MREVPEAAKRMMDKYGKEFKEIFDTEINYFIGMLYMYGIPDFDIVKFEGFLEKVGYDSYSGKESMAEFVDRVYGNRGQELIDELIDMDVNETKEFCKNDRII